jgi:D-3-phosphoglycerate dehydrogenase
MKKKPGIVYPDADETEGPGYGALFTRLESFADFSVIHGQPPSAEEFIRRIGDARGVLLGWGMPGEVMVSCPSLEVISFTGYGVSKFVDMALAGERGITVCNCPGYSDVTVAEHAMALLLAVTRHIPRLDGELRSGSWNQSLAAMELSGKTIGLVGFGGIARHFSGLCNAFGMRVKVWNRTENPAWEQQYNVACCSLDELYADSDIVSLHLAANPQTEGFMDQQSFAQLKDGAILVNTARAELVDEAALIEALSSGKLSAAGLDVYHQEPLPRDYPLISMENVVLTPHVGYNTPEAVYRLFDIAVGNLEKYFAGNPVNVVTE